MTIMNVLCTLKYIVYEYRWNLLLMVTAVGLGFMVGRYGYAVGPLDQKSADRSDLTGLMTTDDQTPVDCWQMIQTKIDEINGRVQELRTYTARLTDGCSTAASKTFDDD